MNLSVTKIRRDGGTQIRLGMSQDTIDGYAEAMRAGSKFPPVVVFFDGVDYWLADGFQRTLATLQASLKTIEADVRAGTQRDAVLHACGANAEHGLRRTNEDKRRAVETLLTDEEWMKWSDREIARQCNVHHQMVATLRKAHLDDHPDTKPRKTTRNGTTYEQKPRAKPNSIPTTEANLEPFVAPRESTQREDRIVASTLADVVASADIWTAFAKTPEKWMHIEPKQRSQMIAALKQARKAASNFIKTLEKQK